MKVSDLKYSLLNAKDDDTVMISVKLPYVTIGQIPLVPVKFAASGFDWEDGNFIFWPEETLTPSDRNFAEQMKKMQDKLGWAEYENHNLKAEIKKLNKQLKVE